MTRKPIQPNPKAVLAEVARKVDATSYLDYKDYLREIYAEVKKILRPYSYLKFSEHLGFSATNVLRLIIIGQRPLTYKAARKVADGLDLHGMQRRFFLTMVNYNNEKEANERDRLFQQLMNHKSRTMPTELDQKQMEYFAEWYHPIIREMVGMGSFNLDPEWIQGRLNFPLRLEKIKQSLELLEKLGVIRFDPGEERYVRSDDVSTAPEIDSLAIVRYHQKVIEMGRESITRIDEKRRIINALTVCLPETKIAMIREKIAKLIEDVLEMEDETAQDNSAVFQLNLQLFPFTKD